MNLTDQVNVSMSFCRQKTKSKLIGLLRPQFATIAKFQWFSKAPSPLNGMVWDNHWVQWFFDGFGVTQPLVSMVYDGCPPLVQRWNGYIPSLKSSGEQLPVRHGSPNPVVVWTNERACCLSSVIAKIKLHVFPLVQAQTKCQ